MTTTTKKITAEQLQKFIKKIIKEVVQQNLGTVADPPESDLIYYVLELNKSTLNDIRLSMIDLGDSEKELILKNLKTISLIVKNS